MIQWMLVWEDKPGDPESAWSDGGLYTDEDLAGKAAELSRQVPANPTVYVAQVDYGPDAACASRDSRIAAAAREYVEAEKHYLVTGDEGDMDERWAALVAAVEGK